jgi:hypothetical protein
LIRDTTKWIVASFAAVAVVLIAGAQLSDIGHLELGTRLWLAVAGAGGAIVGVFLAVASAVSMLTPSRMSLGQLARSAEGRIDREPGLGTTRAPGARAGTGIHRPLPGAPQR